MTLYTQLRSLELDAYSIKLRVPDPNQVLQAYRQHKRENPQTHFPYWTQVWPASLALCRFLVKEPHYIENKEVLELAAGLGLPSLLAAKLAKKVVCSDYLPEAVAVIQQSIQANNQTNIEAALLDWRVLPQGLEPDTLLLSDINYEVAEFETLETVILEFLQKGVTIILSTPQRLMAKSFIQRLLPLAIHSEEMEIEKTSVSIYVLAMKVT